jgi:dTDP-4-amino-4,6-dideoxygalactose transaminase
MEQISRRKFLGVAAAAGTGMVLTPSAVLGGIKNFTPILSGDNDKPALLGGAKAFPGNFPSWPFYDGAEEQALIDVLKTGKWGRLDGSITAKFEEEYAQMMGMKHSLAVANGTTALFTMLGAIGVGPGDEVIMPVYTFVATYNVVVLNYALPILVDTDIDTFQIDPQKMEQAITPATKVLMPVHMGGLPANIDRIMAIAQKRNLPVIEDACQAPGSEWKGRKVGSYGIGGAFSFQSTKNLNSGEGGAIITDNESFIRSCYRFHNQGQGGRSENYNPGEFEGGTRATNGRITEFQANILRMQLTRLQAQDRRRSQNIAYLNSLFSDIPGITPAKLYDGVTNVSYHLYMFRYDKAHFAGMTRSQFIRALSAEGVEAWEGYGRLNREAYVTGLAKNRHYLKIYGEKTMNEWMERNHCPQNDKLTSEESLWFGQTMFLGSTRDMDQIAEAVRKIQKNASQLKN